MAGLRTVTACVAMASGLCLSLGAAEQHADRVADLDTLAEKLPELHVSFFHELDEDEWDRAVGALRAEIETMPLERAVFEFARLCALAGDAHTGIDVQGSGAPMRAMPIGVEVFEDGFFIVLAGPLEAALLGHEITAVNGVPIEQVVEKLGTLSATDNIGAARRKVCQLINTRGALWAAGVISGPVDRVELTLNPRDRERTINRSVRFEDAGVLGLMNWQRSPDFTAVPPPMYLRRASGLYQSDFDEASGTLYIAYNACREAANLSMERFAHQVLGFWDRLDPQRLLIDLRHNSGGNERVINPLIDAIDGHGEIDRPGRLFVAIGPRTFSSAVNNAVTLDQNTSALLVGEPTGASPNHFGELESFELPSGMTVFYSTKFFERVEGNPDAVGPEIKAPRTSEHWFSGRDPVLEAVAAYEPPVP